MLINTAGSTVAELEAEIKQKDMQIKNMQSAIESYQYWLDRYGVNQMTLQKQAFQQVVKAAKS